MDNLTNDEVLKIINKVTKSTNPQEVALKGLYFGRLLYKVGDFSNAIDWIVKYLRKFDRDFQAFRLLGECYEKLSKFDHALGSYKQSLQIKANQFDLVLHVAELLLNPGPARNPTKAQVWLDKAASALPGDPKVFKMKMELLIAQNATPENVEDALLKELKLRPNDSSLSVQYIDFLKRQNRLPDAFQYCKKTSNFLDSSSLDDDFEWHSCILYTYQDYVDSLAIGEENIVAYCLLLEAIGNLVRLCLTQNKKQQTLHFLQMYDRHLHSTDMKFVSANDWKLVIEEMKGQFAWLVGTVLIYQAQTSAISWKEACQFAIAFYSYSLTKPHVSMTSAWSASCNKALPKLPLRLLKLSALRLSQCYHMTLILNDKLGDSAKTLVEDLGGSNAIAESARQRLFGSADDGQTSFLSVGQMRFGTSNVDISHIALYDELASVYNDLHTLTWLGLRWLDLEEAPDFLPWSTKAFPSLKFDTGHTSTGSSLLSLNLLDIECFLAGCVFATKQKLLDWKETNLSDPMSLTCAKLPASLCRRLTTPLQDKWWEATFLLSSKSSKISAVEAAKLKPVLQRGLECIRGVGNHGLDTLLIAKLARHLAAKAFTLLNGEEATSAWYAYQRKAVAYWNLVIPELSRLSEGQIKYRPVSKESLFPSLFKNPSKDEAKRLLAEAYMCCGELAARENRTDDALSFYGKADIPQASFCQAHLYKKLLNDITEEHEITDPFADITRKKELLMKKYRHYLEVTLTRLQQHPDESLHEKTTRLLRSPHVSPSRPSPLHKSANESALNRSMHSTPKANISLDKSQGPNLETNAVNNLVDTITTLTSALSSLQLEMECLREENRMIRNTPTHSHNITPQRRQVNQVFAPGQLLTEAPQQQTPQRYMAMNNQSMPPYANEVPSLPPFNVTPHHEPYQLQNAGYYNNPTAAIPFLANCAFTPYVENPPHVNGYGSPANPNVPPSIPTPSYPQAHSRTPVPAPTLQAKDQESLQQKFVSLFSGIQTTDLAKSDSATTFMAGDSSSQTAGPASTASTSKSIFQQPVSTSSTPSEPAKSSMLQQLLQAGKNSDVTLSTTPVTSKEVKPVQGPTLPPQSTPANTSPQVLLFSPIPSAPGPDIKFQSPEEMDRENQELDALEQADQDTSQNADAGPHFDAIIPLPDLVEVKTGEEGEEVLFEERCKLFRWDADQWKERGLGLMKLLRHKLNGKARLVMRREQVLKVCCNHNVVATTRLSPMHSCERAMVWLARDFAEAEEKDEKFAAKFKSVEIAENFRSLVHREAAKISEEKSRETANTQSISAGASKFKFEMAKQPPISAQPKSDVTDEKTALVLVQLVDSSTEASKPSPFSNLANAITNSGFAGSGPNGGIKLPLIKYSFGSPKPKPKEATEDGEEEITSRSDAKDVEGAPKQEEDEGADEKNTSGPHFQPIIDLPDLVEVKSGEEDEEVVFCHRAKLFRYVAPEWKERGLGEMKILRHTVTHKYRIVMRREQVLKLCANHLITESMRLNPQGSSQKSWVWLALDFSESSTEPQKEMFAVKFKTVEEAKEFHDQFVQGVAVAAGRSNKPATSSSIAIPPTSPSQAAHAFMRKELRENQTLGPSKDMQSKEKKTPDHDATKAGVISKKKEEPTIGFNLPPAEAGSWSCPDCLSSNSANHQVCPCCNCQNPNVPSEKSEAVSKPKEEKFLFQYGTGMPSSTPVSSKFSFGITPSSTEQTTSDPVKQHPALQRAGGSISTSSAGQPFRFGVTDSSSNKGFSASPVFGTFTKPDQVVAPREDELNTPDDDEYDDESDTTETSGTYSDSDDDEDSDQEEAEDLVTHQSPMSKFATQMTAQLTEDHTNLSTTPQDKQAEDDRVQAVASTTSTALQQNKPFTFSMPSAVTFGQLASSTTSGAFSFQSSSGKFDNAWKPDTKPLFASQQEKTEEKDESADGQDEDEDEIVVKPIVELPPPVVVQTGEENETTLFSKRSKLYRWDKETQQWKERGIGNIMIKHDTSTHRFRILMRREQVLKVCANHRVTSDMNLEPSFGSHQAWTWIAMDYADGEEKVERFAVKFKTPELALEFKDQFEQCKVLLQKKSGEKPDDVSNVTKLISKAEKMKSELGYFKDKLSMKSSFGFQNTLNEDDVSSQATFDPSIQLTPLVKQHEKDKGKGAAGEAATSMSKNMEEISKNSAKMSLQLEKFAFKLEPDISKIDSSTPAEAKRQQQRNVSVCSATSEDAENIHFEPIIPLPAKVQVPTGEENEQVIFEDRTKLYVFDRKVKQWKERGTGKIRLLQNLTNRKLRMVMRREQVLKVCLNHMVGDDTNFSYKENSGGKVVVWTVMDFSDSEKLDGEVLQFAMRFKNPESTASFLDTIEDGREATAAGRLLQPVAELSSVSEQQSERDEEEEDNDEKSSPVKSPVKPAKPLFSFDNIESPFKKDHKPSKFVFGDQGNAKSSNQSKFAFDVSTVSFNFGCSTSTPMQAPVQSGQVHDSQESSGKSLFGSATSSSDIYKFSSGSASGTSVSDGQRDQQQPSRVVKTVKTCMPGVVEHLTDDTEFLTAHSGGEDDGDESGESDETSSTDESSSSEEGESSDESDVDNDVLDDDVIFVSEIRPTADQLKRATDLMLPNTFFLYENLPERDFDSEEEDAVLEYISRRRESGRNDEDESEATENDDADGRDLSAEPPTSSIVLPGAPSEPLDEAFSFSHFVIEANSGEPGQRSNFTNMANMPDFAAVATAAEQKHAFGSRVDDAFHVSDEKKVLFATQSNEQESTEHDPQYQPILEELPPLVEVKTGEENEEVLFKERCKLYRFDSPSNSWKERGLGEIKILHHEELNSFRIVMRREQVLKVCANHRILKEMNLILNSEKAWMYVAQDLSEGSEEPVMEKFVVKFKNADIALKFKEVWEEAQSRME